MVSLRLYKTGTADEKRDEAKLATALRVAGASLATLKQAPRARQSRSVMGGLLGVQSVTSHPGPGS